MPVSLAPSVENPSPRLESSVDAVSNSGDLDTRPLNPDATATRLGVASLAYIVVMTLVVTLTPFQFAPRPVHGFTALWSVSDVVMNVAMFVPIGFLFSLARRGRPFTVTTALLLGVVLSGAIEFAQMFESERFTSLVDVATNGTGALLGALVHLLIRERTHASASVGAGQVRALALELPLMGLVYLLVPLLWLVALSAGADARVWLSLPVFAFGGALIGSVHGNYLAPIRGTPIRALVSATVVWSGVSGIMLVSKNRQAFAACILVAAATAVLQSTRSMREGANAGNRRFELPTLRLSLPLFAAYLALAALWPLDGADLQWRSGLGFFPAGTMPIAVNVYRALEHIAAFTLVGYVIAEVRGRANRPYGEMIGHVALWGSGVALLLEGARGIHPLYGASALLFVLASCASVFGGWMYYLQRDHVRALASANVD